MKRFNSILLQLFHPEDTMTQARQTPRRHLLSTYQNVAMLQDDNVHNRPVTIPTVADQMDINIRYHLILILTLFSSNTFLYFKLLWHCYLWYNLIWSRPHHCKVTFWYPSGVSGKCVCVRACAHAPILELPSSMAVLQNHLLYVRGPYRAMGNVAWGLAQEWEPAKISGPLA